MSECTSQDAIEQAIPKNWLVPQRYPNWKPKNISAMSYKREIADPSETLQTKDYLEKNDRMN